MENRPEIKITLKPTDKLMEVLGWIALLFLWGLTIYNYSSLPQIIPVHFDALGKANDFGSKSTLFLLPIIGTIVFVGLTGLNKYPHIFNYPTEITAENVLQQYTNATRMMRYVKLVVVAVFAAIVWMTVAAVNDQSDTGSPWFLPIVLGFILIPLAFFMYQSRKLK